MRHFALEMGHKTFELHQLFGELTFGGVETGFQI
jgi:hypothetical protein